MFGINVNLKKSAAIAAIAITGVMGASNAFAFQHVAEQMYDDYLEAHKESAADTADQKSADTADNKSEEKAESNAS